MKVNIVTILILGFFYLSIKISPLMAWFKDKQLTYNNHHRKNKLIFQGKI